MGSNLVIVAIPNEDDRVWKVSSEKVPHLTVLFLGDSGEVSNVEEIVKFVEHAATQTLRRFYLPVDRRGELGEDKADVLFFKKGRYDYKAIRDFRSLLLKDSNIKTAYDSVPQFETPEHVGEPGQVWIPHLTLGYPTSPAKPEKEEQYGGFYDVCFHKIAVWVGDYEGPEFVLKDCYDEWDALETVPMDVYMSDIQHNPENVANSMAQTMELGAEFLAHYGKKGMRWGVRNSESGTSPSKARKVGKGLKRVAKDVYFETDWSKDSARSTVAHAAAKKWSDEDVPRLNAEYKGTKGGSVKSRLKNPLDSNTIEYRSRSRAAFRDRLNEEIEKLPTNASGNRRYTIEDNGRSNANYFWDIKVSDVKRSSGLDRVEHADKIEVEIELTPFRVQPTFDEDGFIIGFKQVPVENTLAQSAVGAIDFNVSISEVMEHYGTKGMRWGQRKTEFVTRQHQKALTSEDKTRAKRPAQDVRAVPTIGSSKRKKSTVGTKGGEDHPPTKDAVEVAVAKQKLKKSGPDALTNVELAQLQRRLNLENDVVRLTQRKSAGERFVDGLLGRGSKDDRRGAENQAGAAAQEILKNAAKKKVSALA